MSGDSSRQSLRRGVTNLRNSSFVRNVGTLWSAEGLVVITSVAHVAIAARQLGPEQYGVAALILGYAALVYALLEPRSGQAVVKYVAEFRERDDADAIRSVAKIGYLVDAGFALIGFLITVATAAWAEATLIGVDGTGPMLVAFAAGYAFRAPQNNSYDLLTALERFAAIGAIKVFGGATKLALVALFMARSPSVGWLLTALAVGMAVEGIVATMVATAVVRREAGGGLWLAPLAPLRGRGREIASFVTYTNVNGLIRVVANQADIVVLGFVGGPTEAGFYRVAKQISSAAVNVVQPLQSVTYPRFARFWAAGDVTRLGQELRKTITHVGLPLAALAVASVPLLGFAVRLLAGEDFSDATGATQILVLVVATWLGFYWLQPAFFALGQVRSWTIAVAVGVVFAIAGFFVLGDAYGAAGVAWSRLIAIGGVTHLVGLYYLWRGWPVDRRSAAGVDGR